MMQNTFCRFNFSLHYIFRKYSQEQQQKKTSRCFFASNMPTRTSELLHAVPEWVEITHHKQPLNSQNENK